ncbi:MAG: FAD-dependent oxidoreductase, partial [Alphaproteobacteria bacterium]|nr:FAD-dependent oxidoreductase [Alphaproteobacteria bacterium]
LVREEVTGLDAVSAITPSGDYTADVVIVAAGAWGEALGLPITPVKGQMIALAPPPGYAIPDLVIWGESVYLVPRQDRLLVGATVEEAGFDLSLTDAARDGLRARAEALLPSLKTWTLVEHWAGLRPLSPDGLPLLGRLRSCVYVAGGQYRNGILFAPAIADHMCDLVLGRDTVIPEFDPHRFP